MWWSDEIVVPQCVLSSISKYSIPVGSKVVPDMEKNTSSFLIEASLDVIY